MTIEVTVTCDASGCVRELNIIHNADEEMKATGWHTHPGIPEDHYCGTCWPEIKKEIEGIRGEKI